MEDSSGQSSRFGQSVLPSAVIQVLPVPGLFCIPLFVSESEEQEILQFLDGFVWSTELARRTLHFGRKYNYRSRSLEEEPVKPMSGPIERLIQRILSYSEFLGDLAPSPLNMHNGMCIVNEYTRAQGIAGHVDAAIFGPIIYSLSLGEDAVMTFTPPSGHAVPVFIPRFSLLVMSGAARYEWKHQIDKKVSYEIAGRKIVKHSSYRRVSLTYRTMASL